MQRPWSLTRAFITLALFSTMSNAWCQQQLWERFTGPDPFKTERNVSPAPNTPWEPTAPLPPIPAPATAQEPRADAPLTLAALTEFALRNNPRARQAWFAARAAAAGVGIEQADLLPQVSGLVTAQRVRPVSATTGVASPWQNRYGPSVSLSYILFDFSRA